MPFVAVGVEHGTAPLAVRESVEIGPDREPEIARSLHETEGIAEVVILSTCNRTEIYLFSSGVTSAIEAATRCLARRDEGVSTYLQVWNEMDAVSHLFRVASGLESQVLGESQILGQVSDALQSAERLDTAGPHLHSLFRSAVSCARRARAGTELGKVRGSLAGEAVRAAERVSRLRGRDVLIVGGGEICRLVAEELQSHDAGTLFIANRTESTATQLADRFGGRAVRLPDINRVLPRVEFVFSATSAPYYVLNLEDIEDSDRAPTLHIFDLAMPRDVDPAVAALPGIVLHDLDSLLPEGAAEYWREDIDAMESIIAGEVKEFNAWYLTRRVVPVIASLRSHVEAVSAQEVKRVSPQLSDLTPREWAAVESLTGRLIDKMFHHLVVRLRLAAQSDPALVDAAEFFFLHGEGGLFEHAAERIAAEIPEDASAP